MMIKKLIPAAALLFVMGAAQAEVTVYGLIDASYSKNETIGDTTYDFHSGGDRGSSEGNSTTKVGVKGSMDVGSGVKANFKLETGGIANNGCVTCDGNNKNPGNFFNRAAWVGFSGNFGEVRLGRQDNVPFQTMAPFDFNGLSNASSAQMLSLATPWSLTGRQSRSLQYIAPAMGGLTAQAGFVPDDGTVGNKATYSLGLGYKVGKFAVAAAAETARTDTSSRFSSVAASYDFGVAKVEAGYANGGTGFTGSNVGVSVPVAGFTVGLTYAKNNDAVGAAATEFFINREIFKNTYAYFQNGNLNKANVVFAKGNATALGVIYVF